MPNLCIDNETIKDIRVHTFGKTGVDLINYIKKKYGYDFLMDGFLSKLPLDIPIAFGTEKMVIFKTKKRLTGEQMSWHNFKNFNNFSVTEKKILIRTILISIIWKGIIKNHKWNFHIVIHYNNYQNNRNYYYSVNLNYYYYYYPPTNTY